MATWSHEEYSPDSRNRPTLNLTKGTRCKSCKKLTYGKLSRNGRNNAGIITSRHRGGAHKRLYREIDFRRNKFDVAGRIGSVEYDPNRNASICLVNYADGERKYILHARGIKVGDVVTSSLYASISVGNTLPLSAGWIHDLRVRILIDWVVG